MDRLSDGTLKWRVERDKLFEAVAAVWRHTSTDDEYELWNDLLTGLADIDPPNMGAGPQLDDDQLELLVAILDEECDNEIYGQTYPYHPLNDVRMEVKPYLAAGNP